MDFKGISKIDKKTLQEIKGLIDGVSGNLQGLEHRLGRELGLVGRMSSITRNISDMLREQLAK